jgi:hypothetical protein
MKIYFLKQNLARQPKKCFKIGKTAIENRLPFVILAIRL